MKLFSFLTEGINFSITALTSYKSRTILTILGVAIGVFVITGIRTMINSMEHSITKNLETLGNTTMFVHNWPWKDVGDDIYKYWGRPKVSYQDYQKVNNNLKYIDGMYYQVTFGGQTIKREGKSISPVSVFGVTSDYESIVEWKLVEGRPISQTEFFRAGQVCILGYNLYKGLFDDKNALGETIRIRGKRLTVVGVAEKQGSLFGPSVDDGIFVPYKTAALMYNLERRGVDKVMAVKASSVKRLDYVESELTGIMRASRGLRPTAEDNFSINKQEMIMNQINGLFGTLRGVGLVISTFAVLVGLVSIGLIMFISVRERTKQIGIQKSLGASKKFILYQFLSEAVIICLLGGILGLLLVYGLVEGVGYLVEQNELPLEIRLTSSEIYFGSIISLVMGLLAGIIPAYVASSVDPVIALRFK
jgi:putative ABC transport system permease protein